MSEFATAKYEFRGNQTIAVAKHGDDSSVHAEFYMRPFHMEAASVEAGRPIYQEKPYLRITFPSDRTKTWDQPVKMEDDGNGQSDPHRFPRQWQAFINQQEQIPDGTPLTEFPALSRSRVMELKAMGIHTVEQYAKVPDTADLGLGWKKERETCQTYLNRAVDLSQFTKMQDENETLKADIAQLQQQIKELGRMMQSSDDQPLVRRGRPPKAIGE
jgi:hypothetical protein